MKDPKEARLAALEQKLTLTEQERDLTSFQARPLPRFHFTHERRLRKYLAKKAVELLSAESTELDTAALQRGWWARQAGAAMARGYNLEWKVVGTPPSRSQSKMANFASNYSPKPSVIFKT